MPSDDRTARGAPAELSTPAAHHPPAGPHEREQADAGSTPEPPDAPGPAETAPATAAARRSVLWWLLLVLKLTAAMSVPPAVAWLMSTSDQVAIEPGPADDLVAATVGPIRDPEYGRHGRIMLTTINVREMSNWEVLRAKLWGDADTATAAPGGSSVSAVQQMASSQTTAAIVAFGTVDGARTLDAYANGAVVVDVADGSPAHAAGIRVADRVVAVSGTPVRTDDDLVTLTQQAGPGATVRVDVVRGSPARQVAYDVTLDAQARMGVQITTGYRGELPLRADIDGVGGGSGGLMLTLAFIDALSEGDLTADLDLAGTGTIALDGTVGAIRGVPYKVRGARAAGADVFFVPVADAAAARAAAGDDLPVVAVRTVGDALDWLCRNGATDAVCGDPRTAR